MKRGVVRLANLELKTLYDLVFTLDKNSEDLNRKENLLNKLVPIKNEIDLNSEEKLAQECDVLLNEDEVELILDSMSAPSEDEDPNLASARIKLQQFL